MLREMIQRYVSSGFSTGEGPEGGGGREATAVTLSDAGG